MEKLKQRLANEPLMIVTVLGAALVFVLDNWDAVTQLLAGLGVGEVWLNIVLMLITAVVGRAFVKPANK